MPTSLSHRHMPTSLAHGHSHMPGPLAHGHYDRNSRYGLQAYDGGLSGRARWP